MEEGVQKGINFFISFGGGILRCRTQLSLRRYHTNLQEALTGYDKCELWTKLLRLSLASPHPLNQLGDTICDCLK